MNTLWLQLITSFGLTWLAISFLLRGKMLKSVIDLPNERSLHTTPIPRTGGLGLMVGVLAGWSWNWQPWLLPLAGGVLSLMVLSFLDDLRGLPAGFRFLMHFVVAGIFMLIVALPEPAWLLGLVIAVCMVWIINLYNFMDGSDGLAGGMAIFGFGAYAIAAWLGGDVQLALSALVIATSALAFLLYNFHPARIFMGDAGSIPLGFLAGALGLLGWQRGLWPLWFPLVIFSPFVVDATVTLLKRLVRGEKIWQAHRSHYYQRLIQMGWGHRNTALAEYLLMLSVAASGIAAIKWPVSGQMAFGLGWGLAYFSLAIWIDRRWAIWQKQS